MTEKEAEEMKEVFQIKTTPEIEKAIAEQIRTIPKIAIEKEGIATKSVLGVAVCCNG